MIYSTKHKFPWRRRVTTLMVATLALTSIHAAAQIEEIVVTATKRETNLQDTAMSITAFSEFELQRTGSEGIFDYGTKIPNLGFSNEADGRFNAGSPAIRGVAGGGIVGATGFYIDDIPVPEYMNPRVSDVGRIEVLRGPQGTLYGARSMGGTVRMISKTADVDEFSADVHAGISDVDEGGVNWALDGAVNMPLIKDTLAMRALLYYAENSGVFDRVHATPSNRPAFADQNNVDDDSYYGGQITFLWNVTENLTIKPRLMYQRTDSENLPLADIDPGSFTVPRHNNIAEEGMEEWWLGSVTLNLDTQFGSIVSTTAKYDRKVDEFEDQTGTIDGLVFAATGFAEPHIPGRIDERKEDTSIVHETRLIADFGDLFSDRVAMTAGVFYENHEHIRHYPPSFTIGANALFTSLLNAPPISAGIPFPPGALGTDMVFSSFTDEDTEEIALFGEVTIKITDWLRFTGGARWSDIDFNSDSIFDGFVQGGPDDPPAASRSDSSVNPKFLLEADVNEDIMVYGTASKGFRVGGTNTPVPLVLCAGELATLGITNADITGFESDKIWNYEIGTKTSWFDNRLTVNVAGFFIDWSGLLQTNRLACGFQYVTNAGKAENKGFEIEMEAAPIDGLNLSMGIGYVDAEITEGNPLAGISEGDRVLQVPEFTFNSSVEYSFPLTGAWEGYVRGDYSYYGDSLSANNAAVTPRVRDSFELLNLRLGAFTSDNWDVSLFVKNATNEHANLSDNRSIAAEKPGRPRLMTNRPRTIGVEFRTSF